MAQDAVPLLALHDDLPAAFPVARCRGQRQAHRIAVKNNGLASGGE